MKINILFFLVLFYDSHGKKLIKCQEYNPRIPSVFMNKFLLYIRDIYNGNKNYVEYGMCSYYHGKFHGRKTATGDRFSQNLWTGAHRTLPIPSIVLVCFRDNRGILKGVVILLNDRGPYAKKRILDLSYGVAQAVGILQCGYKKIAIFFLQKDTMELHQKIKNGQKYIASYLGILNKKQITMLLKKNYIQLE